ncbi:phage minor head protein, partial [Citrobacter freundii]
DDPLTGETRTVQLGSDRRMRVIYDTNMRTARAAGQWERIQRTKRAMPYLVYTLGPSREHRAEHLKWANICLPVDHQFWITHMVPNGWGCKCNVRQVSRYEFEQMKQNGTITTTAPDVRYVKWVNKRTGEEESIPEGVDPGWAYNPGI